MYMVIVMDTDMEFRIDPAERLDAIYKEISSLHKTYR